MSTRSNTFFVFFFNDTATTEIYTLSLHDALPISRLDGPSLDPPCDDPRSQALVVALAAVDAREPGPLPVGTAAPAPETTGSLEPAQLREHRPCPADRTIAATPPRWDMGLQLAAARL